MHLTRPFLCSVRDCRRCFNTEEDLNEHRKLHQVDGFQCDHCYKKFSCRWRRTRHVSKIHQNLMKSLTVGFGLFHMTGVIQQRQKGRQMMTCLKEGCDFQTRIYQTEKNGNSCMWPQSIQIVLVPRSHISVVIAKEVLPFLILCTDMRKPVRWLRSSPKGLFQW